MLVELKHMQLTKNIFLREYEPPKCTNNRKTHHMNTSMRPKNQNFQNNAYIIVTDMNIYISMCVILEIYNYYLNTPSYSSLSNNFCTNSKLVMNWNNMHIFKNSNRTLQMSCIWFEMNNPINTYKLCLLINAFLKNLLSLYSVLITAFGMRTTYSFEL